MLGNTGPVLKTNKAKVEIEEEPKLDENEEVAKKDLTNNTDKSDDDVMIDKTQTERETAIDTKGALFSDKYDKIRPLYSASGNVIVDYIFRIKVTGTGTLSISDTNVDSEFRYFEEEDDKAYKKSDIFEIVNSNIYATDNSVTINGTTLTTHSDAIDTSKYSMVLIDLDASAIIDEYEFDTTTEQSVRLCIRLIKEKESSIDYDTFMFSVNKVTIDFTLEDSDGEQSTKTTKIKDSIVLHEKLPEDKVETFASNSNTTFYLKSIESNSSNVKIFGVPYLCTKDLTDKGDIKVLSNMGVLSAFANMIIYARLFADFTLCADWLYAATFFDKTGKAIPTNIYNFGVMREPVLGRGDASSKNSVVYYYNTDNKQLESKELDITPEAGLIKLADIRESLGKAYENINLVFEIKTPVGAIVVLSTAMPIGYVATYNRVILNTSFMKKYEFEQNSYGGTQIAQFGLAASNFIIYGCGVSAAAVVMTYAPFCAIPAFATHGYIFMISLVSIYAVWAIVMANESIDINHSLMMQQMLELFQDQVKIEALISELTRSDKSNLTNSLRSRIFEDRATDFRLSNMFSTIKSSFIDILFFGRIYMHTTTISHSSILNAYNPKTIDYAKVLDKDATLILTDEIKSDIQAGLASVLSTNIYGAVPVDYNMINVARMNPNVNCITPAHYVNDNGSVNYAYLLFDIIKNNTSTTVDSNNKDAILKALTDYQDSIKDSSNQVLKELVRMGIKFIDTTSTRAISLAVALYAAKAYRASVGSYGFVKPYMEYNIDKDELKIEGGIAYEYGPNRTIPSGIVQESDNILLYKKDNL